MQQIFITGSNRGIGLAVARELLAYTDVRVFAGCRAPDQAAALHALSAQYPDRVIPVALQVTDQHSIQQAVQQVRALTSHLDVLINNAGIDPDGQSFGQITPQQMLHVLEVNAVAPLMIARAFLPLLENAALPRIVMISSEMASLELRTYGGSYGYCASKAALNMTMRGMAVDLKRSGITTIALDPGWVRTDMGGSGATLAPEESAQGIVRVISQLTAADNGRYLAWDGTEHPW